MVLYSPHKRGGGREYVRALGGEGFEGEPPRRGRPPGGESGEVTLSTPPRRARSPALDPPGMLPVLQNLPPSPRGPELQTTAEKMRRPLLVEVLASPVAEIPEHIDLFPGLIFESGDDYHPAAATGASSGGEQARGSGEFSPGQQGGPGRGAPSEPPVRLLDQTSPKTKPLRTGPLELPGFIKDAMWGPGAGPGPTHSNTMKTLAEPLLEETLLVGETLLLAQAGPLAEPLLETILEVEENADLLVPTSTPGTARRAGREKVDIFCIQDLSCRPIFAVL